MKNTHYCTMGCVVFSLGFPSRIQFSLAYSKFTHPIHVIHPNAKPLKTVAFIESKGFHFLPTFAPNLGQRSSPFIVRRAAKYFVRSSSHDDDDKECEDALIPLNDQIAENENEEIENVDNVDLKIEKIRENARRISATIEVEAPLNAVWSVLTDYERLADFIPGLAVCQLLERRENGARLLQIGQKKLAFGLKFKAKGIVDVYENELEILPIGVRRELDFKMVEGDFQVFEGKWCIEQVEKAIRNPDFSYMQRFQTLLSYIVDVQPKRWLPVALVEGTLSKEIQVNLICVRQEVMNTAFDALASF